MTLIKLNKKLKKKFKNSETPVSIIFPFELIKMKHKNFLEVRFPSENYVIKKYTNNWVVNYSERGKLFESKDFKKEEGACEFLYNKFS